MANNKKVKKPKVSLQEKRVRLAQRRKTAKQKAKQKVAVSLPKQDVHVAPEGEKEKVIPVPFMVWVGKVIAGWAFSQFLTYLWNKIRRKKEDENAK